MKALIVDDHSVVRFGIEALLRNGDDPVEVIHASTQAEGLAAAAAHDDLDLILLDLNIPGGGFAGIGDYGRVAPCTPVVILSSSEEPDDVRRALSGGALGYLPKSAAPETMRAALQLVLSGAAYVPPLVLDDAQGLRAPVVERDSALTPRQLEVLTALASGMSNKKIALELNMSEKTVKAHVSAVFRSLNVVNRMQASNLARAAGLIPG